MLIITIILMPLFVVENLEEYLATSIVGFSTSAGGLGLYVLIFVGFLIVQFFAINFIDRNSKLLKSKSKIIQRLQKVVFLIQYALAVNLVLILVQMFVLGKSYVASLYFRQSWGSVLFVFSSLSLDFNFSSEKEYGAKSRFLFFAFSFLLVWASYSPSTFPSIPNDVANSQDSYAHFRNNSTT